jgi:SAM-dependent methyltransferase
MLDPAVLRFVLLTLPAAPVRVLEVGAGDGKLAQALRGAGYEVVAIDPDPGSDSVRRLSLHELDEPPGSFDAAVAVVSMHHVEPLAQSCRVLAEAVAPGGALVLDEIDVERFDLETAGWWREHRVAPDDHAHDQTPPPEELVAGLRSHCHSLPTLQAALRDWFELGAPTRWPYLYRWQMPPGIRETEEAMIAAGLVSAIGVRIVGARRR